MHDKLLKIANGEPDFDQGTQVKETDSDGNVIGRSFKTVAWNVRPRDQQIGGGCPTWFKQIIVGDTVEASRNGAHLLDETGVDASSSTSSRAVEAIYVNQQGSEIERFQVPFALVSAFLPTNPPDSPMPIVAEILFSAEPFNDTPATPVKVMEKLCEDQASTPPTAKFPPK